MPELLIEAGLNDERAPDGSPVRLRRIVAINEPSGLMLTVYDVIAPRSTFRLVGAIEIEKSETASVTCVT